MNTKIILLTVIVIALAVGLVTPIEYVIAQSSNTTSDVGEEKKDGHYEGKECPSKEKKLTTKTSLDL